MIHRGYFFSNVLLINRSRLLALIDCIFGTEIRVLIVLQKNREAFYWKPYTFYAGYIKTELQCTTYIIQSTNVPKYFIFELKKLRLTKCD